MFFVRASLCGRGGSRPLAILPDSGLEASSVSLGTPSPEYCCQTGFQELSSPACIRPAFEVPRRKGTNLCSSHPIPRLWTTRWSARWWREHQKTDKTLADFSLACSAGKKHYCVVCINPFDAIGCVNLLIVNTISSANEAIN